MSCCHSEQSYVCAYLRKDMFLEQAVYIQYGIYRHLEETYGKWLKLKNAVVLSKLFCQCHISLWTWSLGL